MSRLLLTKSRNLSFLFSSYSSKIIKPYSKLSDPFQSIDANRTNSSRSGDTTIKPTTHFPRIISLPPLPPSNRNHLEGFSIELVDNNIWTYAHNELPEEVIVTDSDDSVVEESECLDFDKLEDLRLRKMLFYKLDRDSKEFEEYNVDFPRKRSPKKGREKPRKEEPKKECTKPRKSICSSEGLSRKGNTFLAEAELTSAVASKRVRMPTFNQLTGPYHLPFCLDIFVTKGSVRACVVHRVTSKVVAVAHSISKDLKFDLGSRKDAKACAAVGAVLAQRAIEDDIHNVMYTPRKGDKLEGKLQVVLQSIIDNGVDVKVKLKQRKSVKRKSA